MYFSRSSEPLSRRRFPRRPFLLLRIDLLNLREKVMLIGVAVALRLLFPFLASASHVSAPRLAGKLVDIPRLVRSR